MLLFSRSGADNVRVSNSKEGWEGKGLRRPGRRKTSLFYFPKLIIVTPGALQQIMYDEWSKPLPKQRSAGSPLSVQIPYR